MTRIKQANRVETTCPKHGFVEHMEYIFEDGKIKYKCLICYRQNPQYYPVYGRQQPQFKKPEIEKEQQFGRTVA